MKALKLFGKTSETTVTLCNYIYLKDNRKYMYAAYFAIYRWYNRARNKSLKDTL